MSTAPSEPQIADDELVVPPLPGWALPAVIVLTALIGLAIWYLWGVSDALSALAGPIWLFLCR